jgi:CRP-like cAMP-binding protein
VLARLKIRNTKALHRVPLFASIPEYRLATAIEAILELTTYKKARQNEVLCRQGEQANDFYIIVSGQCGVTVRFEGTAEAVDRRVATLKELDFFGESALLGDNRNRNATVTVESESAQFLKLSRSHFESLVEENVINHDVVANMEQESERRIKATRRASHCAKELNFVVPQSPPPPPSPPPKQSQQSASGVAL